MNRILHRFYLSIIIFNIIAMAAVPCTGAADNCVTSEMAGHWEGSSRIIVSWCSQRHLPVSLDIQPDGSVTGRIGDSVLTSGRLARNRGWLGRLLHLASDYIIRGKLEGPIVAAEGISRSEISIILDFSDGEFVGGIHTSGSKFGGKEKMILSATDLTLTRKAVPATRQAVVIGDHPI